MITRADFGDQANAASPAAGLDDTHHLKLTVSLAWIDTICTVHFGTGDVHGNDKKFDLLPNRCKVNRIVVQFVAPDSFSFFLAVSFLVGLVIGGVGSIAGCLVGGLFVLYVPNIAESVSTGLAGVVYGVILLLVIFVMPARAAGFARLTRARVARATQPPITKGRSS